MSYNALIIMIKAVKETSSYFNSATENCRLMRGVADRFSEYIPELRSEIFSRSRRSSTRYSA